MTASDLRTRIAMAEAVAAQLYAKAANLQARSPIKPGAGVTARTTAATLHADAIPRMQAALKR